MALKGYPSTPHLPFSPGVHDDDVRMCDAAHFVGREVVITEKLDGGNCCFKDGRVYARTHAHETENKWFGTMRAMFEGFRYSMRDGEMVFGENMTAIHSIEYDGLASYFYAFAICQEDESDGKVAWLSWDETVARAAELELPTVPELFRGTFGSAGELEAWVQEHAKGRSSVAQSDEVLPEGFVIRMTRAFDASAFQDNVAKYVRANHVQTDPQFRRNWKQASLVYS